MLVNHIYEYARTTPDKLAVINSAEEISYRRFANDIEAVRNFLMRTRLPQDGVIVTITSNLYHDWVRLLALQSLGHTTIAGTSWSLIESLCLRDITGLVCSSNDAQLIESFRRTQPDSVIVEIPGRLQVGAAIRQPPPLLRDGRLGNHIIYTSGTTGSYKKLLMPGDGLEAHILDDNQSMAGRIRPEEVFHSHSFGPWTAAGYAFPQYCWYFGASVVFEQRANWADHFFDHDITKTFFVPWLVQEIRKKRVARPAHHTPLQVLSGGGFLSPESAREAIRALNCELVHAYGASEFPGAMESLVRCDDDVIWLEPCANSTIEIVDDNDMAVRKGLEGMIRIRTKPYMPKEYLDDPESTARHFRNDWFYPGDMAVQREDGRIRVLGRVQEVINLAGNKIALEPFERAAADLLGVSDLCAFSQQDDQGNDLVVFVIEGEKLPDRLKLEKLADNLKQSAKVRFSLINKLPRGTNGMMKVNRRKVLELVRASWKAEASAEKLS